MFENVSKRLVAFVAAAPLVLRLALIPAMLLVKTAGYDATVDPSSLTWGSPCGPMLVCYKPFLRLALTIWGFTYLYTIRQNLIFGKVVSWKTTIIGMTTFCIYFVEDFSYQIDSWWRFGCDFVSIGTIFWMVSMLVMYLANLAPHVPNFDRTEKLSIV